MGLAFFALLHNAVVSCSQHLPWFLVLHSPTVLARLGAATQPSLVWLERSALDSVGRHAVLCMSVFRLFFIHISSHVWLVSAVEQCMCLPSDSFSHTFSSHVSPHVWLCVCGHVRALCLPSDSLFLTHQ